MFTNVLEDFTASIIRAIALMMEAARSSETLLRVCKRPPSKENRSDSVL
jgi:hypothetical protein